MRLCLAFAVFLAATSALAAPPVFRVEPDTIRADSMGMWHASLVIENPSEWGLYVDSLKLEWRSLDEQAGSAPRSGTSSLQGLVGAIAPAGAGERTGMAWTAPADFERGTLRFRVQLHDAQKHVHTLDVGVVVTGNDYYERNPVTLLAAGTQQVEVVHMAAAEESRPAPCVLYVPPQGVSARAAMRWGQMLVNRGHAVSVVSLPGAGRSTGGFDRAGPASVAAVEAALSAMVHQPGVDPKRLAIWGVAEGGTAALLAAGRHPELQAVVAQDASYDAWATYRALDPGARVAYVREAGSDSAGWRARSPLGAAVSLATPVLVVQTSEASAPAPAAVAFATARLEKQLPVESRIGSQEPRPLRRQDVMRVGFDYLARRLRHP